MFVGIGRRINWLWVIAFMVIVFYVSGSGALALWWHSQYNRPIIPPHFIPPTPGQSWTDQFPCPLEGTLNVTAVAFVGPHTINVVLENNEYPTTLTKIQIEGSLNMLPYGSMLTLPAKGQVTLSLPYCWIAGHTVQICVMTYNGNWLVYNATAPLSQVNPD